MPAQNPETAATCGRPSVAVVLCTWNGERHLGAQLDSLAAQSWPIAVHVHDDASGDASVALARRHGVVDEIDAHPVNVGFVANFERAITTALERGFDYVALADQDDVWSSERVAATMRLMLESEGVHGSDCPVLVHSDLAVVDGDGAPLHRSFLEARGYALGDARDLALVLGQNGVMGNTVLVNRALAELALPFPPSLHVHDWWLALMAELHGVRRFEPHALVDYRSHADNASNPLGSIAPGASATLRRVRWRQLRERDFRLPFLEDSRRAVLEELLASGDARAPTRAADRALVEDFLSYLRLERPRASLLRLILHRGFLRGDTRRRLRVALALLLSRRYDGIASPPERQAAPERAPTRRRA